MEAHTEQTIRVSLEVAMLSAGLLVAAWVAFRERRNPPDRVALTAAIAERSWSLAQVVGLLCAVFSLYIAAGFLHLFFRDEQLPLVRLVATWVIYGTLMTAVALILRARGGGWSASMGLGRRDARALALSPIFYLAALPFIILLSKGWHQLLNFFSGAEVELQDVAKVVSQNEHTPLSVAYMVMAIVIAPIYEEVIFRGVLFPWFTKRAGLVGGVVATSILFAVMHQHAPSLVPLGLLSATLCLAYWRTGSLWTSVGVHILFNAVTILALNVAN